MHGKEVTASSETKSAPAPGNKWAPGAEPLALCMSCNATFPPESTECPQCHVALSSVRKCPHCERIQSAQHVSCIYCANSFLQEEGLGPVAAGPIARQRELSRLELRITLAGAVVLAVLAGFALYKRHRTPQRPQGPIGQSYVLRPTSMRSRASLDAPPIMDVQPGEIVNITDYAIDAMGNRWFRVTAHDISGFVRTQEVAPPKGTDPENSFVVLRHSLLGLDDPAVLPEASAAVDYYRRAFPGSLHADEVRWLLAEQTRELAERTGRPSALLANAREQYERIAQGSGEFAQRARELLSQLPPGERGTSSRQGLSSAPLEFSLVGGSSPPSHATSPGSPRVAVRRVTVLSRTPLLVRLTEPVQLSLGTTFQGEIEREIRVNNEVAIPKGSVTHLMVAAPGDPRTSSSLGLRVAAVLIDNQIYRVSAAAVRVESPSGLSQSLLRNQPPPRLSAGTRVEFRLNAPLVVTRP